MPKTEKDLWIEMSIREIWTQSHFAGLAFSNIDLKAGTDGVFSSIHSFLSHCANVSKMLKAIDQPAPKNIGDFTLRELYKSPGRFVSVIWSRMFKAQGLPPKSIGDILGVSNSSIVHKRQFRNDLEHYDSRLKTWIKKYGPSASVGTYNMGPKSMLPQALIQISHYDPTTSTFTFVNKDFNLQRLHTEVCRIKEIADMWVKKMQHGQITPPFG